MRATLPIILPSLLALSGVTAQSIFPGTDSWTYQGCYTETTTDNSTNNVRALSGGTETAETMTVGTCLQYCQANKYTWAGLEYTKECYCAASLNSLSQKVADTQCNLACVGNQTQFCGGALKLSVYQEQDKKGGAGRVRLGMGGSVLVLSGVVGGICALW